MNTTQLAKRVSKAFGKKQYLLGTDESNTLYWLSEPKWDCGWYWGFGYISTFTTNQHPEKSKDINSHEHASDFMSKWFTSWNGSKPRLQTATFNEKEGWELSELFEQFYFLQSAAENFGRGKCHVANTEAPEWKKTELTKEINETLIPAVTKRIMEILTP